MVLLPLRDIARQAVALTPTAQPSETVSLHLASGRVLTEDTQARTPLPARSHAVMDGYALGAAPPGLYRLAPPDATVLESDEALAISAGQPVPEGTATVVLAARATLSANRLTVEAPAMKNNIRYAGEEAKSGTVVLRAGTRLDARHLALATAAGLTALECRTRLTVALLGVGTGAEPLPHMGVLGALLRSPALASPEAGVCAPSALARQLDRLARTSDIIVVTGDSLGDETGPLATALSGLKGSVALCRAAMKPAKPILLGKLRATTIIGLSGTAYATAVAAHLVLRPMLRAGVGLPADAPLQTAIADFARQREPGRAEALPVTASWRDGRLHLASAGRFGQLSALAAMDGFAMIEAETGSLRPGDLVLYHPLAMPLV